jgi:hypothetical protein
MVWVLIEGQCVKGNVMKDQSTITLPLADYKQVEKIRNHYIRVMAQDFKMLEVELKSIGAMLEVWAIQQQNEIEQSITDSGDDVSEFAKLSADARQEWFSAFYSSRNKCPETVKKYAIRYALHQNELGIKSIKEPVAFDYLSDSLMAILAAEKSLRLTTLADVGLTKGQVRSELAKLGALEKLRTDPKQKAKAFVKQCWQTWQEEPERYKSKAAFAKEMLKQEQCKSLVSQVKITDWCRAWEKSHPAG